MKQFTQAQEILDLPYRVRIIPSPKLKEEDIKSQYRAWIAENDVKGSFGVFTLHHHDAWYICRDNEFVHPEPYQVGRMYVFCFSDPSTAMIFKLTFGGVGIGS